MGDKSGIEWTDATWNPTTGCDRISRGCDHCYALTAAARMKAMGQPAYQRDGDPRTSGPGFALTLHPDRLEQPLRWRRRRRIFVNSMSDLFHKDVPDAFLDQVFDVMERADHHIFQVLTKRAKNMSRYVNNRRERTGRDLPGHIWLGTSVEDQLAEKRIPWLRGTPAAVRFLSVEPMIGPPSGGTGSLLLSGIDWVIVGGESGAGARPLETDWVRTWIRMAREADVAVFVKQLGAVWAKDHWAGGRRSPIKGGDPSFWPADLRVRELPPAARMLDAAQV